MRPEQGTAAHARGAGGAAIPIAGAGAGSVAANVDEVARVMTICNACRYCEGFCAVFPAMTRRLEFPAGDVNYLANLCHNCGACYHACQYAPPHEFSLNVPRAMARVRADTYSHYAWPAGFGALYRRNGLVLALALAAGLALFVALLLASRGALQHAPMAGNFYAILPHGAMVPLFTAPFAWAALALAIGVRRFWRDVSPGRIVAPAAVEAAHDALSLRYLDGGGDRAGCNEADDAFTPVRRRFHHLTFYGFLACFAATASATIEHYVFGVHAPYPVASAPVLLGTFGGLALLVGPAGLLWLNLRRHPETGEPSQRPMDRGFIALLLVTSATGLALLLGRDTGAMGLLLALHLGAVMALFVTLPYGKFAHGVYRSAALLKYAIEKRQPDTLGLGGE